MKRLSGWSGVALLVGTLALAAGGERTSEHEKGQRQASTPAEARQGAERLAKSLEEAWNQGRFTGLEQTLAEDVLFSNPSGKASQGRDEMVATMKKDRQAFGDSNTHFEVTRVDEVAPGVVLADITHRFSKPLRLPNGRTSGDHTQIVAVLNREGDQLQARSVRVFMPMPMPMGEPSVGGAGEEGTPQETPKEQAPMAPDSSPDPSMQPQDRE